MKLLYETLNRASLLNSNRLYQCKTRESSRLEPRRPNPLDRYPLPEDQLQTPSSKPISPDYHTPGVPSVYNQSYHDNREQTGNKQDDPNAYGNTSTDDEPAEQYLQVDPRCYVRQKSNASPRLEKGHSINVDTRPSPTSASSLSPYRQSSFDVALAYRSQNQQPLTPSPALSTQKEIYFTPRGSSFSVVGNVSTNTPPGSQHLSPPTPITSRQNTIEKKDVMVQLDASGRPSAIRSSIVQREHEHSRSLEHSSPSNNSSVDKQSRSFDAVHLLRPVIHREDGVINRRTRSYEYAEEHQPSSPIAPPPIIIKIPDMRELVQAAQLSQLQNNELDGYKQNSNLTHKIIINNHNNGGITSQDLWRLRQSYEFEEQQQQQQLDGTSPEDLSPDLLTSTSIDSAGAMAIHQTSMKIDNGGGVDDNPSKYESRRKSSSNLLLPPPEVRRQALRRTFEKRRSSINQSNARLEQQLLNNQTGLDDDYNNSNQSSTIKSTDFSSLLNNFNSKSENSSFERSLETDFDMQSDTSSRGPNDHFTSIESSGNENAQPDVNHRLLINRQQQQQFPSHQDDSGYKSLESQNSQNRTISLDWMSADGGESVIYIDGSHKQQQRSVDLKDVEEDLTEQEILNNNRPSPKFHQSYQETSTTLNPSSFSNSNIMEQRSLSLRTNLLANKLITSSSFNRTASKKRREFGKDKRHATSNVGLPHVITTDEYQFSSPIVHQINEINTKQTSSSTLQVRHPDLRRSKSDQAEILDFFPRESTTHSNESDKNNTHLPSSADDILPSAPLSNPIRVNNTVDSRHIFQRSPSSTTPPVTINPQIVAFRSQRGSISFDTPTSPINSPTSNTTKTSTTYSVLPTSVTKPRLKFSMVRDTTTASLGSTTSSYSMSLANDFTIDEKTNRIINEFLMQDNNNNINNDVSYEESPKHHHQRIRQKTFDETIMMNNNNIQKQTQQQSRIALIKQRQHSFIQANIRQQPLSHNPYVHLVDNSEQNEDKSSSESRSSTLTQQSGVVVRQDNGIAGSSPSIIVTGYDSGS